MRYWVTFIDDCKRYCYVVPMQTKNEMFATFKKFKAWAENTLGCKIKALCDDKSGEYISKEFDQFCEEYGIARQHTVHNRPHTVCNRPQQNGVAERFNCTTEEGIIAMLQEAGLPPMFCGEALCTLVYMLNRTPSSAVSGITPFKAWFSYKPDVSNLHILALWLMSMCNGTSMTVPLALI